MECGLLISSNTGTPCPVSLRKVPSREVEAALFTRQVIVFCGGTMVKWDTFTVSTGPPENADTRRETRDRVN